MIKLRESMTKKEEGFTLIELMVVVLIIAILIAIAIPTFLGARKRAQDRAAQSNVRNAFTAEKVYYTDNELYTASDTDLTAIEPSLKYEGGDVAPHVVGTISVAALGTPAGTVVVLGAYSASGTCFYLKDDATGPGTLYGRDDDCAAPATAAVASSKW